MKTVVVFKTGRLYNLKVEFVQSDVYSTAMCVSYSEFVKGKNNRKELESLKNAVDAFATWCDVCFCLSAVKYNNIIKQLEDNGMVYFTAVEEKYPTRRWLEVIVSNNNQPFVVDLEKEIKDKRIRDKIRIMGEENE